MEIIKKKLLDTLKRFNYYLSLKIKRMESQFNINENLDNLLKNEILSLLNSLNDVKDLIRIYNHLYKQISIKAQDFNKGIHPKHRIVNFKKFFVSNIKKNSKVLDVGCGAGTLSYSIAKKAQKVIGIDISKSKINRAKARYSKENIEFIQADILQYEFDEKFDYIILSNILEHIEDRYSILNKFKPLTKIFLIRVPMINRSWLSIYTKELNLGYIDSTHRIEYTLDSFKKEMESVNLKIVTCSIQFGQIWAKVELK